MISTIILRIILFKLAYVEDLNGPWLFESMYSEDPEASKLAALPGMEELLEGYPFTENNIPKLCRAMSGRKIPFHILIIMVRSIVLIKHFRESKSVAVCANSNACWWGVRNVHKASQHIS